MSITITPLTGRGPSPLSYLLTVDNARVLLDCGTFAVAPRDRDSSSYYETLSKLAPSINLVLLTHPLLKSVGCLPWLKAKCGLRCPVYATLPTRELGRWAVEEWIDSRSAEEFNVARLATPDDKGKRKRTEQDDADDQLADQVWRLTKAEIADAFMSVNAIRWNQPVHLAGALKGYTMMAHRSGHTLGGAIFTIRPSLSSSLSAASSSSSFLYAPIFNHVKEHHLDGAALLQGARIADSMRRMGVVVVGAQRSTMTNVKRIDREKALLDLVTTTLDNAGSVMIPTDSSGRLLELLVLLESHWAYWNLGARYPLVLVSRTGKEVVSFIRSLTEWMGGQMNSSSNASTAATLRFTNLRIYASMAEADASIPSHVPKCILAAPLSMSYGMSRRIFVNFASRSPANVVVLTSPGDPDSLGHALWRKWNDRQPDDRKWGKGNNSAVGNIVEVNESIPVKIKRKVYLEGQELVDFEAQKAKEAADKADFDAQMERRRRMMQADDSDSDSDSDDDDDDDDAAARDDAPAAVPNEVDAIIEDAFEPSFSSTGPRSSSSRTNMFTGGTGAWDEFLDSTTALSTTANGGRNTVTFDIYVKGAWASREVDGRKRYRMFPVIERKRRVDVYGEAVDVQGWLKRGMEDETAESRKLVEGALAAGVKRARDEMQADGGRAQQSKGGTAADGGGGVVLVEQEEAPHKFVVEDVDVHVLCRIQVIDMEGQSDGRALKTILPQINPRKLVIVNGTDDEVNDLAAACRDIAGMTRDIYTPLMGETLVVGEETKNFTIRLGDSVMSALKLSRVDEYDVAFVSGVIRVDAESDIPVLERPSLAAGSFADSDPTNETQLVPAAQTREPREATEDKEGRLVLAPLTPSLFIGDLRLAVLRDRLRAQRVPAEFVGEGVLVCGPAPVSPSSLPGFTAAAEQASARSSKRSRQSPQKSTAVATTKQDDEALAQIAGGKVAVRKAGRGQLFIEGSPGETYALVRKEVYALHAQAS